MGFKRSGTIVFHAKMPSEIDDEGRPVAPTELEDVRAALSAADAQLANLQFFTWTDEQDDVWYQADAPGFFLKSDLKRIGQHLAATARPECWVLIWLSDDEDHEYGLQVFRDTVSADEYLRD